MSILNSLWVSNPQLSSFWLDALASCLGHFLCSVYSGTLSYGYLAIWPPCNMASKGGAVVRALASHQCGLGSIPGPGVICGLSLLLVLSLLREVNFSRYSSFPLSLKANVPKFQFDLKSGSHPNESSVSVVLPSINIVS